MQLASVYAVDAEDRITSFRGGLGPSDDAPPCADVIGHSLFDFVAGGEVVDFYRLLLDRVRAEGRSTEIPFRCDGPHVRRFMSLTLVPDDDGVVGFRAYLEREEQRPAIELLRSRAPRDERLLRMCSWCKRVDADGWVEVEEAIERKGSFDAENLPELTHGICDSCEERLAERYFGVASSL